MRKLENKFHNHLFYTSTFDPQTGILLRAADDRSIDKLIREGFAWEKGQKLSEEWRKLYDWRRRSFSPVPETLDVAINTWCNYGCTYCYTNATTKGEHAPLDLIEAIFTGFDQAPYQVAYGGGSPTQHPKFIEILEMTRQLGSVPNYTTEGQNLTDEILDATNQLCGGVALTYHAARGLATFQAAYARLLAKVKKQINVHVIADKDVVKNLKDLCSLNGELGPFNLVLLAYYPDVGRSNLDGLMPKKVYMQEFPEAIKTTLAAGNNIAFSEGLLPYFLSRPELGVDTRMATASEGRFSAFIDMKGRMSTSSFDPPHEDDHTIYEVRAQQLWNKLGGLRDRPYGASCYDCRLNAQCSVPDIHHYLICKYADHNDPAARPESSNGGWDD